MDKVTVEVCYAASSEDIFFAAIDLAGNTVRDAVDASGIFTEYENLNLAEMTISINSKKASLDDVVRSGDRIAILRPLKILPHEARRLRAKKVK